MKLSESLLYEKLNYIPASFYLKSFYPDFDMKYHIHDYFEIMYAVSGNFKLQTKNKYSNIIEEKIISEGQFVFIDSNNTHRLKVSEHCKICNLEIFCETNSAFYDLPQASQLRRLDTFCAFVDTLNDNIVLNDTENILGKLKSIHDASDKNKKDLEGYLHVQSLMLNLLIDIGRCYQNTRFDYRSLYITKCLNIINNNLSEKLSPKKIAKSLMISESYLHRQFKTHLGITFCAYVNKQRVELAKNLLLNTNDSITKISESVGFGTRQYFNHVFNQLEKNSPAQYRKINMQKQYNKSLLANYSQTQISTDNKENLLIIPPTEEIIT